MNTMMTDEELKQTHGQRSLEQARILGNPDNYEYITTEHYTPHPNIENCPNVLLYRSDGYNVYHVEHLASGDTIYKMRRLCRS